MPNTLFKKMTNRALVLTANSRLTLTLQSAFDLYQQQHGARVWETPRIFPLLNWLQQQFHLINSRGVHLLNDFQEECIWQEIIQSSNLAPDLLQPAQMAKLVKQAWQYFIQWQVPIDALEPFNEQAEVHCLIEWMAQFHKRCTQKNWITMAELPREIQAHELKLPLPEKIIIIGFDDLNPSLQSLFSQLSKRITIDTENLIIETASKKQIILDNADDELITMAKWAKSLWLKNSKALIGCVIPTLEKIRPQVQRVFMEVFCNEQIIPGLKAENAPFNISASVPLSHHNMIHTALTVLNWCHTPIPIQDLAPLLQSPYLCSSEEEKNRGAQMDALLRNQNKMHINITDLFSVTKTVSRWRALLNTYHDKQSSSLAPSEWAQHFMFMLKTVEWPSHRTQTSAEYQILERFKKLLLEFSQLDFIFHTINFRRALFLLNTLTQQTLFQPQSHHETIQIMGVLEASGILFDSLWVMGLHDGIWPPATKPHPLIPYAIQQHYQMPHATAKRELQFCKHMTQRLENAAKQVIFSSPAQEGDQLYFPSQLIQPIPMMHRVELLLPDELTLVEKINRSGKMEIFEDNKAPTISNFSQIYGGSSILKLQALCPFRAFTTIRLKASVLNTPVIGIPAVTKGILIHHILFELWGQLKDQKTLNALTEETLTKIIHQQIDKTFSEHPYEAQQPHNHYFYQVEKKRLHGLIKQWLTFEKSRPYFRVIEREADCNITINQLPIKIRLDRVDQLSDGSLFMIDYKTGLNSIAGWFQERLSDPQLPLYAAFQGVSATTYSGISFAEIRNGDMKFKGVLREDHLYADNHFSGLIPIHRVKNAMEIYSWDGLLDAWKTSLEKLSLDFCQGDARVDPIKMEICMTCDLKAVCRIRN